ncbi:MAG: DUF4384 domain-containing protein [Treponema sp.]|jgi:hypothetical protein|nr:DUF4384 domain-containing protein [Treponema sp.]
MKKIALCLAFVVLSGMVSAQDIDVQIQQALDDLAVHRSAPATVSITPPVINGTHSVSAFSRYLYGKTLQYARSSSRYRVQPLRRGLPAQPPAGEQSALIQGSYRRTGNDLAITLSLVSEHDGAVLASTSFTTTIAELEALNLNILPENRETEAEAQDHEAMFDPPMALPGPSDPSGFFADAWPNEDSRTYFNGDNMTINLYASRDSYVKVYHIGADNQLQLIYPNRIDTDNSLKANTGRAIPENTSFVLGAPYGEETIYAVFSDRPFENLEEEMQSPVPAERGALSRAASRRGLTVQLNTPDEAAPGEQITTAWFHYTILPASLVEETFSYPKPEDVSQAVDALRTEILSQGGLFSGNDREGLYSLGDMSGSYRVSADEFIITVIQPPFSPAAPFPSGARSAGGAYSFFFNAPANIPAALAMVQTAIERNGGVFSGDTSAGLFRVSGIRGNYHVADRVSITIHEKPFVISYQLIEKEIKNYFGIR